MKRVTFTELYAYLFVPGDPEREIASRYTLEIPIPEGPEMVHDSDAMLITVQESSIKRVLSHTASCLGNIGYEGNLYIVGMEQTPEYGYINFGPTEPLTRFDYEKLVEAYEDVIKVKKMRKAQHRIYTDHNAHGNL